MRKSILLLAAFVISAVSLTANANASRNQQFIEQMGDVVAYGQAVGKHCTITKYDEDIRITAQILGEAADMLRNKILDSQVIPYQIRVDFEAYRQRLVKSMDRLAGSEKFDSACREGFEHHLTKIGNALAVFEK